MVERPCDEIRRLDIPPSIHRHVHRLAGILEDQRAPLVRQRLHPVNVVRETQKMGWHDQRNRLHPLKLSNIEIEVVLPDVDDSNRESGKGQRAHGRREGKGRGDCRQRHAPCPQFLGCCERRHEICRRTAVDKTMIGTSETLLQLGDEKPDVPPRFGDLALEIFPEAPDFHIARAWITVFHASSLFSSQRRLCASDQNKAAIAPYSLKPLRVTRHSPSASTDK